MAYQTVLANNMARQIGGSSG
ncbi:hypothetical protein CCACVL1_22984 [Corchorus capsularis]|uniref:Uncharacterized protein n=1 Tax=Corchorus capsularis TaxID=210143 RepID=A0A1R3GVN2_COCAP|nr:hypothetical protein CCACVL1_22984 [Corchorus capsularis]